jgi:uncharacterized protein (DUF924 family)
MSTFATTVAPTQGHAVTTRESFVEMESLAGRRPHHRADAARADGARADVSPSPLSRATPTPPTEALVVVDFWRAAGPARWFAKDPEFDQRFGARFLTLYESAAGGELDGWLATPCGALALLLLLDQFPRNAFRGTPRMYATDAMARAAAAAAIDAGHDHAMPLDLQVFFYLPFAHSEDLADQDRSVALVRRLGEPNASHAERHRGIVRRFGRFPHRNPILGRTMTPEEQRFLDEGGYAG